MNGLALCAGIEGLGLSLSLVDPEYRNVACVEREAYAAALLATRMEAGILDPCPIWDDLCTFDGRRFRGLVDIVTVGAPCQPYSVAGKRQGDQDDRYLWPDIFRIIDECRPALVFLENVTGLLQWFRPIGEELCRLGFEFEAGIFSAAECGASHRRERLFILAYREPAERWPKDESGLHRDKRPNADRKAPSGFGEFSQVLGYAASARRAQAWSGRQIDGGYEPEPAGCRLADAVVPGLEGWAGLRANADVERAAAVGDQHPLFPPGPAARDEWQWILERWPELAPAVAESERAGFAVGRQTHDNNGRDASRHDADGCGPQDRQEETQSELCRLASGSADPVVGHYRTDRLRADGNLAVPICAAFAFITLWRKVNK